MNMTQAGSGGTPISILSLPGKDANILPAKTGHQLE